MKKLLIGLLLAGCFAQAQADTQYVTDVLYIPMRSGAGNQFRIIHSTIKSGTAMNVIEYSDDDEWAHVTTPSGLDGWVRKQYLINTPTARQQLESALENLNKTRRQLNDLEERYTQLSSDHQNLTKTAQATSSNRNEIEEELKNLKVLSADAVNLSHRYKELLAKHDLIRTEYDAVLAENDRLKGDKTVNQWLFGAGLVVVGMFLMLVLPALKPKKRNSEWSD